MESNSKDIYSVTKDLFQINADFYFKDFCFK